MCRPAPFFPNLGHLHSRAVEKRTMIAKNSINSAPQHCLAHAPGKNRHSVPAIMLPRVRLDRNLPDRLPAGADEQDQNTKSQETIICNVLESTSYNAVPMQHGNSGPCPNRHRTHTSPHRVCPRHQSIRASQGTNQTCKRKEIQ